MKTLILAAIRCSLMFTAVTAFCVATPAKANMITTFNVSGLCAPQFPFTARTFGGTITIDVTAGTVTAMDVTFQSLPSFNTIKTSEGSGAEWSIRAGNSDVFQELNLEFTTGPTPGSLVGFTGGTIMGIAVADHRGGQLHLPYTDLHGSITAPTTAVPDEGSSLTLLGIALPCLLGLAPLRRSLS